MIQDYITYVLRNLERRRVRSLLTMLGIFIGIAAVVALLALGQGLEDAIIGQFASLGTDKITVTASGTGFGPPGSTAAVKLTEQDLDAVRNVAGVQSAASRLIRTSSIEYNDIVRFGFLTSIPQETKERTLVLEALQLETIAGRMLSANDQNKAVLGHSYYDNENYFEEEVLLGKDLLINGVKVEVVGFLDTSSNPQLNDLVLLNEDPMKEILGIGEETDLIAVQVWNEEDIPLVRDRIEKELRRTRNVDEGKEDFTVETPQQLIETFTAVLGVVQGVILGIAAISLFVGGVGIANTMFTTVLERRKEIGVMKAVGANTNAILLIFLLEAGVLGLVGGFIGLILGIGFAEFVVYVGSLAVGEGLLSTGYNPLSMIGILLFAFVIGILSGAVPAWQAANIPPVEALRK